MQYLDAWLNTLSTGKTGSINPICCRWPRIDHQCRLKADQGQRTASQTGRPSANRYAGQFWIGALWGKWSVWGRRQHHKPLNQIYAPELLSVLKKVENRDALDVAGKLLQRCNSVFRYAVQTGRAASNPVSDLQGTLKTRKVKHQP